MKPHFAVLHCTQSLLLGALRRQGTGAAAPAPLGPGCGDPGDAPSRIRRHRRPRPGTAYLPRFLTSSLPGRGPRRAGSAGQGRAKPPLTTISPGVPRRSRRGSRALPGADSPLPAGTTPAAGIPRNTTGGPLPVSLIPPELPEQGWHRHGLPHGQGRPCPPPGAHPSGSLRAAGGRSQGSLGGKG